MTQKVIKVGTSAAVTLSKETLKDLGVSIGDSITVEIDKKGKTAIIKSLIVVDKELVDWTKNFIHRYRPALEALAKK